MISACESVVDIVPPPYDSKIVVNGLLSNEEEIRVTVSYSVMALSSEDPKYLENAVVEIWEDGVSLGQGTYDVFDKFYAWNHSPNPGSTYRIRVQHPSYPVVDQTLLMPDDNAFANIQYEDSIGEDSSGQALAAITIRLEDPADQNNYYRLNFAYYNDIIPGFLPFEFTTNDAVLLSPSTVQEDDGAYLFDDQLFNGQTRNIRITFSRDIALSTPRFLISGESLSQDLYRYQFSLARYEDAKDNPFSEPVFIHSNIDGGLGIWAGKISQQDTIY